MQRIDTSNITDIAQLPIDAPRLDFLQDNANLILDGLIKGITNYTANQVVILWGCGITYTPMGATATLAAGAIYYNGLVYYVPGNSLSAMTSSQIPLFVTRIIFSDQSTPATFLNGDQHPVLKQYQIAIVAGPAGGGGVSNYAADYDGTNVVPLSSNPTGTILTFAASTAPLGYLECNGASLLRANYPPLFAVIGTTYGSADGSHFTIPDLRGQFVRGWDDGAGVDSGRAFGSNQGDQFQDHEHNYNADDSVVAGSGTFPKQIDPGTADTIFSNPVASSGAITGNHGAETRPKNVAMMLCIKY